MQEGLRDHTRNVTAEFNFHFPEFALQNLNYDELLGTDEFPWLGLAAVKRLRYPITELFDAQSNCKISR